MSEEGCSVDTGGQECGACCCICEPLPSGPPEGLPVSTGGLIHMGSRLRILPTFHILEFCAFKLENLWHIESFSPIVPRGLLCPHLQRPPPPRGKSHGVEHSCSSPFATRTCFPSGGCSLAWTPACKTWGQSCTTARTISWDTSEE